MSDQTLYRSHPTDLEVRSDGRTVRGIAVPYDDPTLITMRNGTKFTEVFQQGSFARSIEERGHKVKFLASHDHMNRLPLGRATLLREDPSGLYAEFAVSKTRDGDEVLELVRDGTLDALSIGFQPVRDKWSRTNDFVHRLEAKLLEVSAVVFPAFSGATILGVRADGTRPGITAAEARLRLMELESSL